MLRSGEKLSHYEIISAIGKGGMGEVFLAQDTKLDRKVAIKFLNQEFSKDAEKLNRFIREAKAASALNHPNILTIHEIGEHDGTNYIVTELIDGKTLREHLSPKEPLQLNQILKIGVQVAEALSAAHHAGIIHRDIKPENIMIRKDGYAKVLDFGLAKLIEKRRGDAETQRRGEEDNTLIAASPRLPVAASPNTEPGMVMGTVSYMSPEQARGNATDARTDIWSLGVVLYEMLAGKVPFAGETVNHTIVSIFEKEPLQLENIPVELQRIVRKSLTKDVEMRYQSARDLLIDLKNLRRDLDIQGELERSVVPNRETANASSENETATFGVSPSDGFLRGTKEEPPKGGTQNLSSAEYLVGEIKRHKLGTLLALAILAVVVTGVGFAVYRFAFQGKPVTEHFRNVKFTRVTAEGGVESATISPDGKYIAYSLEESGKRSLWTKHLATESRIQIVPPVESISMYACTFSPDGGYVYYTRQDDENPKGALYTVPVLGGVSRKIVTNVSQPVSVSRDGKQIVFGRYKLTSTDDHLMLVDSNGSNERLLATVREPEYLQGSRAAWSPDGKMIAIGYGSVVRDAPGPSPVYQMTVSVISPDEPVFKPITSRGWANIGNIVWFNDGSGLAFVAGESRSGARQIWQCSFPAGEARRITNDLNSYDFESLSLTADDKGLIAVQKHPVSQIWVAPGGDVSRARRVVTRKNVQDGRYGLGWTPDGRLIYDSSANSNSSIWSMNADGSDAKQLTDASSDDFAPEVAPDGRHIIFGSLRNGFQIWRMDIDGGNPRQMTSGTGAPTFSYSPDGRWVVFNPYLGGIFKIASDGGDPIELAAEGALVYPQISPNGDLLAYFFSDKNTKRPKFNIVKLDGGALLKTFDLPVSTGTDYFESLSYRGFHWSPDGTGLVYINTLGGVSNLWRQPLDGGPPKQITDFKSDRIYNFAYARDGRTLAFARGSNTPDAVLITDVR